VVGYAVLRQPSGTGCQTFHKAEDIARLFDGIRPDITIMDDWALKTSLFTYF